MPRPKPSVAPTAAGLAERRANGSHSDHMFTSARDSPHHGREASESVGRGGRDPQAGVKDVTTLLVLSEESVMQNTMVRFARDELYTFVGTILLAVNPYKMIPSLYGEARMKEFLSVPSIDMQPHIYAVVERAYRKACNGAGSQSLIVSGESGAGKTESTKVAISYVVWRSRSETAADSILTMRILQANPLLEALGNATTTRNTNSSRFGKCVRLAIDPTSGALVGGQVITYLLEKSRVTFFGSNERNFHVFYQLLAGVAHAEGHTAARASLGQGWRPDGFLAMFKTAPAVPTQEASGGREAIELALLQLTGQPADYSLLHREAQNAGVLRGINDLEAFEATCEALDELGFSRDDQINLFGVMAMLLHLGNVEFEDGADGRARAKEGASVDALRKAASVLMEPNLEHLITVRVMHVGGETMRIDLRADQAALSMQGLLKSTFSLAFAWVVKLINAVLTGVEAAQAASVNAAHLDMLDIFGFENFRYNSFEQLCINFANEKLHQLFLHAMFKAEQEVIAQERVAIPPIEYTDNAGCLAMLELPPNGIFQLLDTCCRVNTTPANFCLKVHEMHAQSNFLALGINGTNEDKIFNVRHFAGTVTYSVSEFLTKNTETMETQTRQLLGAPRLGFLLMALDEHQGIDSADVDSRGLDSSRADGTPTAAKSSSSSRRPGGTSVGKVATTTGKRFTQDMSTLMVELQATTSHFVHCVKPNDMEQAELLSYEIAAEQLASLGTLEVVQLMGLGFPVRIKYGDVRDRYKPKLESVPGVQLLSPKLFTEMILEVCEVPPGDYKLGVGRIFLKHRAAEILDTIIPLDTSLFAPLVRAKVAEFWAAAERISRQLVKYWRKRQLRKFFNGIVVAQKYLCMWLAVRRFRRMVAAVEIIQHAVRARTTRLMAMYLKLQHRSSVVIQTFCRQALARRRYLRLRNAAIAIQRWVRALRVPKDGIFEKTAMAIGELMRKLPWFQNNNNDSAKASKAIVPRNSASQGQEGALGGLLALLDSLRGISHEGRSTSDAGHAPELLPTDDGFEIRSPLRGQLLTDADLDKIMDIGESDEVLAVMKAAQEVAATLDAQEEDALREINEARPEKPPEDDTNAGAHDYANSVSGKSVGSGVSSAAHSAAMPIGWKRFIDSAGRAYFHNPSTGKTQWEPPILRYQADDDDGLYYYYDPVTRETTWDEPEGIAGWQNPERSKRSMGKEQAPALPGGSSRQPKPVAVRPEHMTSARLASSPPRRASLPSQEAAELAEKVRTDAEKRMAEKAAGSPSPVHRPAGWGAGSSPGPSSAGTPKLAAVPPARDENLVIKDLDSGRTIPFEHADILWQPMLVRDLDSNILLPFSPDASNAATSQEMLNPPTDQLQVMTCVIEEAMLPPPLSIPEYHMYKVKRKKRQEMFSACQRRTEEGNVHFDIRWRDGPLRFTGKLELLSAKSQEVLELAMYDDYINYYGFPRELGFIRVKRLVMSKGEVDSLIEVIIPRITTDGSAAQFRVNAVPGQTMLTMFKQKKARDHMFVLRGRLSLMDSRAMVELRQKDEKGNLPVVLQARRMKSSGGTAWRIGFTHPLSAFQSFCTMLALKAHDDLSDML